MQLILWRHAQAEDSTNASGDPRHRDLARELTLTGEKQARRTAEWLRPRLPAGSVVLVSPAIRTVQTAQQLTSEFERLATLAPDTEPAAVLEAVDWARGGERVVVVVGHQPTLGRVAGLLLTGQDQDMSVRKSAAWWFQSGFNDRGGRASLRAVFDAALG
ncbi:histidine phosphatase family protein [Robbsia sp. Bb-Pol-6]|uniref:Histidine phosphatase family protein n=1 Tax=Robbsia betulipollinis TaxID=2981849 RepID=A0ABT3ZQI9_9BURK|nr:histidine phosphatase family protein [Robbsia betulipollinis]MCY0388485.1 histidine phosphatase family protein [Robbsia betulipollinis]